MDSEVKLSMPPATEAQTPFDVPPASADPAKAVTKTSRRDFLRERLLPKGAFDVGHRQKQWRATRDHVHAGRDHRRGVDERAHRCWTLHGVRQPRIEGQLGRFPHRTDQEAQRDGRGHIWRELPQVGKDLRIIKRLEVHKHQKNGQEKTSVSDPTIRAVAFRHSLLSYVFGGGRPAPGVVDRQ